MIGVSCPAFSVRPFDEVLEEVSRHFRLWEILSDADHFLTDIAGKVKSARETHGMEFQVHLPFSDMNIAAPSESSRRHAVETLCRLLECADELEMGVAVLHPGYVGPMGYYDKPRVPKLARRSLEEIADFASDLSVKVALENMPDQRPCTCKTPDELAQTIRGLDMGMCFDIGHANNTGNIDGFLAMKERFLNVHLHDNLGDRDKHMPVGAGSIDFGKILAQLGDYNGNYVVETRNLPDAVRSKEYLEELSASHGLSL